MNGLKKTKKDNHNLQPKSNHFVYIVESLINNTMATQEKKQLMKNKVNKVKSTLYVVLLFLVNSLFRALYVMSWPLLFATYIGAIPIYIVAFIFFNEKSDLFTHIIYDEWFKPIQTFFLKGL